MRHIRRVGKPLEVLIVTKDPFGPWGLESILQELHPRSHWVEATSASDALSILRGRPIGFVIADYVLTGPRTGLDLWQIARILAPDSRFLLMSDLRVDQYLDIVSGFTDPPECIEKPVQREELRRIFHRFFDERGEHRIIPELRRHHPMLPRAQLASFAAINI